MSQHQIDIGEQCTQCGSYIFHMKPPGHPCICPDCKLLDRDDDECDHSSRLRCPKCKHSWGVWDGDVCGIFEEGVNAVTCPSCDHDFEVTTSVSYTFTSPAIGDLGDDQ